MFGFESFEDVEGLTILDLVAPQHTADFKDLLKRLARGEKPPPRLDLTAQRADGSAFEAVMEFSPATYEGEPCQQIVFRLPASSPEAEEELRRLKTQDPLTGLSNRTHFIELIDEAVARAIGGATDQALLLLEPDNYRHVLNTVGITGADDVLRQLAGTIKQRLRATDTAGRIGDHAFGILLSNSPQAEVQKVDRKSTRLNSSHPSISYAVFCLKKKMEFILQTNGILIDERFLELFHRYGVRVGVSVDGGREATDRHRRYANVRGSYDRIPAGIA